MIECCGFTPCGCPNLTDASPDRMRRCSPSPQPLAPGQPFRGKTFPRPDRRETIRQRRMIPVDGWSFALTLLVGLLVFVGRGFADAPESTGDPSHRSAAPTSLRGTVHDAATARPLPLANVTLIGAETGAATNDTGAFELHQIQPGRYTLVVSYVGYESYSEKIEVRTGDEHYFEIALQPTSRSVDEVHVSARASAEDKSLGIGVSRISAEELATIPSAFQADVFRSLQKLPGVKASSDFSSGLHIRGGSPDQTLILLDGATLYNPSHFLGLFSSFNPDAVDGVTLHKGAFPARFGGRLGSVVDITQRSGSKTSTGGRLSLGLLASRAAVGGPLKNGSWTVAVRRSTLEPVLGHLNARGIDGLPDKFRFYDINGKGTTRLSSTSRLELSLYTGHDEMDFPFEKNLVFDVAYGNQAGTARWSYFPNNRLIAHVEAAASRYTTDSRAEMTRTPFNRYNQMTNISLKTDADYRVSGRLSVSGGAQTGLVAYDLRDRKASRSILDRHGASLQNALFLQGRFHPNSRWTLEGGLRSSHFASGNHVRLAPRFSATYKPAENLHLQLAGGRHYQYVTRTPSQLLSSFDAWMTAAPNVRPAESFQLTAGLEWLSRRWQIDVEAYYRTMEDLFKLDTRELDASGKTYRELFRVGSGYAFGMEALLQRRAGRLNGFLAYTYGKTREQFPTINGGRFYAPRYDRTHELNLAVNLELTEQWQLSGTFTYATGQPYTQPASQFVLTGSPTRQWRNLFVTSYNNARLPSYRRTDVGITRTGRLSNRLNYEAQLQVVNALGTDNSWLKVYDFSRDYSVETTHMPQIPIPLPNLSFAMEF